MEVVSKFVYKYKLDGYKHENKQYIEKQKNT